MYLDMGLVSMPSKCPSKVRGSSSLLSLSFPGQGANAAQACTVDHKHDAAGQLIGTKGHLQLLLVP